MFYEPFHDRFPKIAEEEVRTIIILNDPDVPEDRYILTEAYCNEVGCDCRRVFFNVFSLQTQKLVAVIAYGWENKKFYRKWFRADTPEAVKVLKGPALNPGSPQAKFAPALLKHISDVLQDKNYLNRIKRHYRIFKDSVDKGTTTPRMRAFNRREIGSDIEEETSKIVPLRKIRRNAPCTCGSGKKHKHCCGNRPRQ
ncbi:SEC-C metal-binding domain-containing protein [Anaerolineales bacterium HSG25]|nr:SEC-C metal-binding domain-containing protein [Anaerolineales bacterium HSG25]